MTRILVVPESLRSLSTQLQRTAQELNGVSSRVASALNGLDWEARQRASVDGMASDARNRATALASQAEAMARYLTGKAQAFEEADQQGIADIEDVIRRYPIPKPVPTPIPEAGEESGGGGGIDAFRNRIEFLDRLMGLGQLAAATVIGASMYGGTTYAGQVIINLPDWLGRFIGLRAIREAAGLSGHLNHFRYTSLPSHMLAIGLAMSVPVIVGKWAMNIGDYLTGTSTGTRTASAMAVDAALTLAPVAASFAVSQIVTWGGAALGTLLFPGVGTAAGYAAGVAATSLIAGVAASIATQWAVERETVIQQVDDGLRSVARSILSGGRILIPLPSLSR